MTLQDPVHQPTPPRPSTTDGSPNKDRPDRSRDWRFGAAQYWLLGDTDDAFLELPHPEIHGLFMGAEMPLCETSAAEVLAALHEIRNTARGIEAGREGWDSLSVPAALVTVIAPGPEECELLRSLLRSNPPAFPVQVLPRPWSRRSI